MRLFHLFAGRTQLLALLVGLGCALTLGCDFWSDRPPPPDATQLKRLRSMPSAGVLTELTPENSKPDTTSSDAAVEDPSSSSDSAVRVPTGEPPTMRGELLPFDQWSVGEAAADALARIGAASVPELTAVLSHTDPRYRQAAVAVLGRIGPEASAAVPALVERLSDVDPLVRRAAARALGQVGPNAAPAVPQLIELMQE